MPLRSVSVQVRPPSLVRGSLTARSATTLLAAGPDDLRKAVSPSCVTW